MLYSRCIQKTAIHCVQQMCSEVCGPLCSAHVSRRPPYPAYWSLTSMVVPLIRGSLFWQTSCIAVPLTNSRSRLCGCAVHRPYVATSLRHPDTPLWDKLLFSSIYCKTQFTSRQHNNNINYNSISINTQLICYMFRLFLSHHQAYTSRTTVFSVLSYSF